jgi:hypothetical protein
LILYDKVHVQKNKSGENPLPFALSARMNAKIM